MYVLEFAKGFPWLVKRTIAHITRLAEKSGQQGELFASILRLDDLFDEELEGLDEIEREYLTKIAARLPADYNQLQTHFDEDPRLTKILEKLIQSRLLRLSGSTYDTYNDVFKEYLVYKKLPEFKQSIMYRTAPTATLKSFQWAVTQESFAVEDIEKKFNISRGSAFNKIRELTALNLIKRDGSQWIVPRFVIDIFNQGRLGEYLRGQLVDNTIVANLISRINQNEVITTKDIPTFLATNFPFIDATPNTWKMYAAALVSWLTATKLVELNNDTFQTQTENRKHIIENLGNLSRIKTRLGRHKKHFDGDENIFLPCTSWNKFEMVVNKLLNNEILSKKDLQKAETDLRSQGWLEKEQLTINSIEELKNKIEELLSSKPYSKLWEAIKTKKSIIPIFKELIKQDYSPETLKWRLKTLLSWAKAVDIIPNKRTTW